MSSATAGRGEKRQRLDHAAGADECACCLNRRDSVVVACGCGVRYCAECLRTIVEKNGPACARCAQGLNCREARARIRLIDLVRDVGRVAAHFFDCSRMDVPVARSTEPCNMDFAHVVRMTVFADRDFAKLDGEGAAWSSDWAEAVRRARPEGDDGMSVATAHATLASLHEAAADEGGDSTDEGGDSTARGDQDARLLRKPSTQLVFLRSFRGTLEALEEARKALQEAAAQEAAALEEAREGAA